MASNFTDFVLKVPHIVRRVSNFAPIGDIAEVMSALITIIDAIIEQVKTWNSNAESTQLILSHANLLIRLLEDLVKLSERQELPQSFAASLEQLHNRLVDCQRYCGELSKRGKMHMLCLAGIVHPELQVLDDLLSKAVHDVTLAVSTANLHVFLDYLQQEPHFEEVALYENRRASSIKSARPLRVSKPVVKIKGSMLTARWIDIENARESLLRYDIQYHKGRCKSTTILPPPTSVTLELPPGAYSLRVRAVNAYGPGLWSEATDVQMEGVPQQPPPPKASRVLRGTAVVSVPMPSEKQEMTCLGFVLQYRALGVSYASSDWSSESVGAPQPRRWLSQEIEYVPTAGGLQVKSTGRAQQDKELDREYWLRSIPRSLDGNSHTVVVANLDPDTVYQFRTKLRNHIGESDPSDAATADFTPGPVPFIYAAKRSHNQIELHWGHPEILPDVVENYEVQKRRRGREWEPEAAVAANNTSLVVEGLGARTAYFFRVSGVTASGRKGAAVEIYTKTRMHSAVKGGLASAAFGGGTLLAPLLAPIDHQIYLTRVACKKGKEHNIPAGVPIATSLTISPVFFVVDAMVMTAACPAYGCILAYRVYKGKTPFIAAANLSELSNSDDDLCEIAETSF